MNLNQVLNSKKGRNDMDVDEPIASGAIDVNAIVAGYLKGKGKGKQGGGPKGGSGQQFQSQQLQSMSRSFEYRTIECMSNKMRYMDQGTSIASKTRMAKTDMPMASGRGGAPNGSGRSSSMLERRSMKL